MKKITLMFAVALGLAVATFVGLWSSNSASAGRFEDGLKCYGVRNVLQKGPPNQEIYISDQFEAKNLIIKKPVNFCTLADKGGIGGTTAGRNPSDLVCYAIKDAPNQPRFVQQQLLTSDQFYSNFLQLVKPYSLCEPAEKALQDSGTAAGDQFDDFAFKCYRIRRNEHSGVVTSKPEPHKISIGLFDQFGGKDVRLGRPTVFCTAVEEKKDRAKNDHIENARTLTPEEEVHVSTISASRDRSDPETECEGTNYGHSVWYTYTPGYDQKVRIDTQNSTYDTFLAIFRGDPSDGNEVACDDDGGPDLTSEINTQLDYGQKYFILVAAFGGTPGGKLKLNLEITANCESGCTSGSTAAAAATSNDSGGAAGLLDSLQNLVCYSLSQPAPGVSLATGDQLYGNLFDVGRGVMYCTPAEKCVLNTDPAAAVTGPQKGCSKP